MEQVLAFGPPPLPPKTRRSAPEAPTVATSTAAGSHVVKIRIDPDEATTTLSACGISASLRSFALDAPTSPTCVRINLHAADEMIQSVDASYYYVPFGMASGQVSPSDTLDSGTCSDLDGAPKTTPKSKSVTVTVIGGRAPSLTSSGADADSDDDSNISCDSLNSADLHVAEKASSSSPDEECAASAFLPQGLLQDIRERSVKLSPKARVDADVEQDREERVARRALKMVVEERTFDERRRQQVPDGRRAYESDKFISFHLDEMIRDKAAPPAKDARDHADESFAGYKDLLLCDGPATIRSAKGTIRGVRNRVRAGIATFLSINDQTKTYKEKDAGKVVVYTTTMGIVRDTYHSCMKVKQILRTQLVRFEERDVFMSADYQAEIRDRMRCNDILVPQVFVDGQHIGDAETVEKLNESGELRRILKPYKTMDACTTCKVCGGYNLLPCPVCNGSKKSVHRNHFTTEFVALKCMNCDEVGLVKCTSCAL